MQLIKTLFKLFAGLLVFVMVVTVGFLYRTGGFKEIESRFAGSCESLPLPGSAEDIQLDRERGFAYLSVLDRRALAQGQAVQGEVLRVDLEAPVLQPVPALENPPAHFRPHGMSLYIGADGQRWLFVLNHPVKRGSEPEMVELFRETTPGRFAHSRTFSDPLLISPNDLVAVGPAQFYVANDKVIGGGLATALQQLGIGASPLVFVAGDTATAVVDDIASGGGINVSADGQTLYVSETSGQRVRVLERTGDGGAVRELGRIKLGTAPDNIDVAPDGSLWIGAHANVMALAMHFARGEPAPSQVLQVEDPAGASPRISERYLNTGEDFSASSVGVSYEDKLLVGSITEKRLLVCRRAS